MINATRPVGMPVAPAPYQAYGAPAAAPVAGPQPVAVYVPGQPPVAAQGGGIMQVVKDIFSGIINFFKKLFGGGGATTTPGTVPGTTPTPGTTPAGQLDDATLAQQFGLRNDPANVAAFREILARTQAEPGVIGPGTTNTDAVKELQQVLTQFGFPVAPSGQFDPATAEALMAWKTKVGLTENFVFANGQAGTTPFVDARTRTKMIEILQGGQPTTGPAGTTPTAPPVSPVPPVLPPAPPPLPPAPPPAPPAPPPAPPAPPPVIAAPPTIPTPTTPPATPTTPAAGALTAEQSQIAKQAGILETPENFAKFMVEAEAIEKGADVVGPGLRASKETCTELQQVLNQFGYQVAVTGAFDQATVAAVLKFKKDNNITYGYLMADGSAGVHPFIDNRTKDVMIKKLGGQ